jgi:predicted nucleic acid-binding protein
LQRGLIWRDSTTKMRILQEDILPQLDWVYLKDQDWIQAAQFWSQAVKSGRQLSDIDFLLAAVAWNLDAIIVSNDTDWRRSPQTEE